MSNQALSEEEPKEEERHSPVQQSGTTNTSAQIPEKMRINQTNRKKRLESGHKIMETHETGTKTGRVVARYISSGAFGDVYEVKTTDVVPKHEAMKMITLVDVNGFPLSDAERIKRLRPHVMEAHFMIKLGHHPNLIGIRAAYQINNDFFSFIDLVPGGLTLKSVIKGAMLVPTQAITVAFEMAKGLAYMHDTCGIRHLDLKPANVLVELANPTVSDNSPTIGAVKLTDFGCSGGNGCTWAYASPETRAFFLTQGHYMINDDPNILDTFSNTAVLNEVNITVSYAESKFDDLPTRLRVAAPTQDQWSWAVIVIEMFTGVRVENAGEVPLCLSKDKQPVYDLCIELALRCLHDDPSKQLAMREVLDDLLETLGDRVVAADAEIEALSLMELWCLNTNVGNSFYTQIASSQEDYELARQHLSAAREIAAKMRGVESNIFATSLNNLALLLSAQGKHDEAKVLYHRAIEIGEKTHGPKHTCIASRLNNLAESLRVQCEYDEAKRLYERAIKIWEEIHGLNHPLVATGLNNLAGLLSAQGQYCDADPLFQRSLAIREKAFGHDHPNTITARAWIADNLEKKSDYIAALPIMSEVVASRERTQGKDHLDVASALNSLAGLLRAQGKYNKAMPLYERSLNIRKEKLGPHHPDVAQSLNNLAGLFKAQGKNDEAKPLYQRAIKIWEDEHGLNHPLVATGLNNIAGLLVLQGKYDEAKPVYDRAIAIGEKTLGLNHPELATRLNNLAGLLSDKGEYDEAKPLFERAIEIWEQVHGANHPQIATGLNNLASLLQNQGNCNEAKSLRERALSITQNAYGPNHPQVAISLNDLALSLQKDGRLREALNHSSRALDIAFEKLGANHPHTKIMKNVHAGISELYVLSFNKKVVRGLFSPPSL